MKGLKGISGVLLSGTYFNAEIGRHWIDVKKVAFHINIAIHHRADESSAAVKGVKGVKGAKRLKGVKGNSLKLEVFYRGLT